MSSSIFHRGPALAGPQADGETLESVHQLATACERCDLYRNATQVVFGEGSPNASVILVGEQPGDKEDLAGRPFVGPAGHKLDICLAEAGIDRSQCYLTNAVKHFKFEERGKRRLHAKPNSGEIQRCAYWLAAEIRIVKPRLVVAMGATALASLLGRNVRVTRDRGKLFATPLGFPVLVTVHPSFLLRLPDPEEAAREQARFVDDLRKALPFFPAGPVLEGTGS
ncbi:UdgX family uracil-DNA binding protein [Gellertiella hungarica]|uniref:Type-4 uracil-DNA glycosylase n=1 Tax=Gellertiella hungarica TaxID=1572859 RepID=A0A7W6J9D3_9HYPH|nr:UdgX family uracil-DNA binding protein [Gellertiella hungarica]MBB4067199.1 DNA polymerase [Gellertiella hungarica]